MPDRNGASGRHDRPCPYEVACSGTRPTSLGVFTLPYQPWPASCFVWYTIAIVTRSVFPSTNADAVYGAPDRVRHAASWKDRDLLIYSRDSDRECPRCRPLRRAKRSKTSLRSLRSQIRWLAETPAAVIDALLDFATCVQGDGSCAPTGRWWDSGTFLPVYAHKPTFGLVPFRGYK